MRCQDSALRSEWISSVNNSRLDAAASWMKVISCTDSAVQGNDIELVPTIKMERGHSVEGSFSREFSSIYIVRELSSSKVGYQKTCALEKTTPCWKILKILFRKDSRPRRSTSCVQISWNLADQKSVKSCIIYLTKKLARSLASARIAPKICHKTMYSQCPKCIQIGSLPVEL